VIAMALHDNEEMIAHVLCSAHWTAQTQNSPNEERAILHVAQSFADELAGADPEFDRLEFIEATTEHQRS
jgi:hypothetical protein